MIKNKLDLIGEQTSPLFRIMWIHNHKDTQRRTFDNNICAFHIGNGLVLSVAHNLRIERQLFHTIEETLFQAEIVPHLDAVQLELFGRCYPLDLATAKRYVNIVNPEEVITIKQIIKNIGFDTRYINLMNRDFCSPHLIIQFKNNEFYKDATLTANFTPNTHFHDATSNRDTFLMELELVEAFYNEDIALYRIINTPQTCIDRLPKMDIDFSILEDNQEKMYCVQSSPNGFLGRLMNKASIEGYLDHHGQFLDSIGGNYIFEGMRYLIKGYFRFGSSGAPYVFYDNASQTYKANAIQSEACPVQLSINNNREGNFQYVNAIASPLQIIQEKLEEKILLNL